MIRLLGLAFRQGLLSLEFRMDTQSDVQNRERAQKAHSADGADKAIRLEGPFPVIVLEVFLEAHGLFLGLLFFEAGAQLLPHVRREVNDDIEGRDTETHTEAEDGVVQQVILEIVTSVFVHDIYSTERRGLSYR